MMNPFDDLARAIASGISRREALKRMGAGLGGILLTSMGVRKAFAATVTCGTCQACDLDTGTCGLPCPDNISQSVCMQASNDGSYIRLASYLNLAGYASSGNSSPIILYQDGKLFNSGLASSFAKSGTTGKTATIFFSMNVDGDMSTFTALSTEGNPVAILNVTASGRVQEAVLTQEITTSSSHSNEGQIEATKALLSVEQSAVKDGRQAEGSVKSLAVPTLNYVCTAALGAVCKYASNFLECEAVGTSVCAGLSTPEGEAPFPFCEAIITFLCSKGSPAACTAAGSYLFCNCAPNKPCKDPAHLSGCCPPCMDCVNGNKCEPNATCADSSPDAVCCNNICCPDGFTCVSGQCTSPNAGCVGATCSTFVQCSSSNSDCVCGTIAEGGGLCVPGSTACADLAPCNSSADCGADALCLIDSCCGQPVCVPIALSTQCPSDPVPATRPRSKTTVKQNARNGPTIGHR